MDIQFENDDLVKVTMQIKTNSSIPGEPRNYQIDCWFQVMFIDSDGTFIARLKKYDNYWKDLDLKIED